MSLAGVDVSNFQGDPGTWEAAAGQIDWAAVKFTELSAGADGGYTNPDAAADWAYLKAKGYGRVGYLFGHPSVSAEATVAYFIAEAARLGLDDDDAVAVDLETSDAAADGSGGQTPAQVAAWAADVCKSLHTHLSRTVLLYTNPSFAEAGNCAGLGSYPLWIADYSTPAGSPPVPAPWTTWAIHQYADSPIDRDVASYASRTAMAAALGKTAATTPAPSEDPMLLLNGANADTPIPLPAGTTTVWLGAVQDCTVNYEFHGSPTHTGLALGWKAGAKSLTVPAGSHLLRVYRPADGAPDVPVTVTLA